MLPSAFQHWHRSPPLLTVASWHVCLRTDKEKKTLWKLCCTFLVLKLANEFSCMVNCQQLSEVSTGKSQTAGSGLISWPRSQMALVCHMCVLLSSSLWGCFHIGQTLEEEKRVQRGFFFFFLMSHSTGQKLKEGWRKNTMPCNPIPPSVLPENTPILHHICRGLTVKSVYSSTNGSQLLHLTLCHDIKGHAGSTFKWPGKHNGARGCGETCICVQDEEGGWVCHGKMEALWGKPEKAGFLGLYIHTPVSSVPFPWLQCSPCPLNCLATSDPLMTTLFFFQVRENDKERNQAFNNSCPWNSPSKHWLLRSFWNPVQSSKDYLNCVIFFYSPHFSFYTYLFVTTSICVQPCLSHGCQNIIMPALYIFQP